MSEETTGAVQISFAIHAALSVPGRSALHKEKGFAMNKLFVDEYFVCFFELSVVKDHQR